RFLGDSLSRLREFDADAKQDAGYQLDKVQRGEQPDDFKPMPSIGKGVEEIRICSVQGQILLFAFIHKRRQAWNYRLIIISECINFLSKGIKQVQEQRW
ncbi:TPA: type II toxin-antitoxin system RelE/ParE family toxin, partial [Legionella pneumophila]